MDTFFSGNLNGCHLGAFISPKLPDNVQYYASLDEMQNFNAQLGKKISVYTSFVSWEKEGELTPFPMEWCEAVCTAGAIPHVTWEPWDFERISPKYSLDKIAIGKYDDYITQFAQKAKEFNRPFFLRWAQEMNGFWYPWDGTHNFNDTSRYIAAYRHIHDIFKKLHVNNAYFVWSPEVISDLVMENPVYDYNNYYPGDAYVDWIGIDGLNFGPSQNASTEWKSFDELFDDVYIDLVNTYPDKPIMIASTGSGELGGDKPQWVRDGFEKIKTMDRIKLVSFFNIEKEANWRIDSSPESLQAFRESVADPYFLEL